LLRIANEAHRRAYGTVLRYVSAYYVETFSNHKGWAGYLKVLNDYPQLGNKVSGVI
jgi:hypothetical protein